ncbi:hypothetical protein HVA01_27240 [Halovibrio variabilis]|uniref:Uncharacterized protein n=1 Tax=Halovibrio variabilis TaxID=31910 RepID=A0A511UTN4_9GAMM|nr:hypothetical protein [Halovibrio variabilis]GEN29078.1 hypothetical protein HVA01_27240 [Halovibrio variabilis]
MLVSNDYLKTGIARTPRAIFLVLGKGTFIAVYTLVGGPDARQAVSVLGFAVLLTLGNGLLRFVIAPTRYKP